MSERVNLSRLAQQWAEHVSPFHDEVAGVITELQHARYGIEELSMRLRRLMLYPFGTSEGDVVSILQDEITLLRHLLKDCLPLIPHGDECRPGHECKCQETSLRKRIEKVVG